MKKISLCFMLGILLACCGEAEMSSWKAAELVNMPGVVYSLRYITLTRSIEELSLTSQSGKEAWRLDRTSYNSIYSRGELTQDTRATGHSSQTHASWGVKGGLSLGLVPYLHVGGEVGGAKASEEHVRHFQAESVGRTNKVDNLRNVGTEVRQSEDKKIRLGKFKIRLQLALRGQLPGETFKVGGPNAVVTLTGVNPPILIPFKEQFELGYGERLCELEKELEDVESLESLKDVDWDAVSVELGGSQFPIISKTGEDVLQRLARAESICPTTEFAIEGVDAKLNGLSPWRIQTKFPRRSGKGGQVVTVAEAVVALNEQLAQDEYLSEQTLKVDAGGKLVSMNGQLLGKVRKVGKRQLVQIACLVGCDDDESQIWMEPVPQETLALPLGTFTRVLFTDLDVADTAEALYGPTQRPVDAKNILAVKTRKAFAALAQRDSYVKSAVETAKDRFAAWEKEQAEEARNNIKVAGLTLVRISGKNTPSGKDVLFGQTEVTQAQWYRVMQTTPSRWKGLDNNPVENVTYRDVMEFITRLNELDEVREKGLRFRLPTSNERIMACRAGSVRHWGMLADGTPGTSEDLAWTKENALGQARRVASKVANAWGLFDMQGNVWEWCADTYDGAHLIAGGSYAEPAENSKADSLTTVEEVDGKGANIGFRVVAVED